MRKVPDVPFPVSMWPHALVQVATFCLYIGIFRDLGYWPSVDRRLEGLSLLSGWYLPVILWLVFVLLLGELVVRQAQAGAVWVFPRYIWGFRILVSLLVIPLMHSLFVLLECVLFWVVAASYPLDFGPIRFYQGLRLTFMADAPLMLVFAMGEALRQWWYAQAMSQWHLEKRLRRERPSVDAQDEELS